MTFRAAALVGAMLAAIPAALAGQGSDGERALEKRLSDERSFFHLPDDTDFRTQWISRGPGEEKWPFTAQSGCLMCAWLMGQPAVYFVPDTPEFRDEASEDFPVLIISIDPFEIILSNAGHRDQFVAIETIEEKIKRMAPYVALGHALCEQPRGGQLGPAEL
jgi:hypothetical protein